MKSSRGLDLTSWKVYFRINYKEQIMASRLLNDALSRDKTFRIGAALHQSAVIQKRIPLLLALSLMSNKHCR